MSSRGFGGKWPPLSLVLICLLLGCVGTQQPRLEGKPVETTNPVEVSTSSTSTTTTTTSTTTTSAPIPKTEQTSGDCVREAGYGPESVVYLYRNGCGRNFIDRVKNAARRAGVNLIKIHTGLIKEKEISILTCFFGEYYLGNPGYNRCPILVCSKTGETYAIDSNNPKTSDMKDFAMKCRSSESHKP